MRAAVVMVAAAAALRVRAAALLPASTSGNGVALTGHDLRAALHALLAGEQPCADQRPAMGCRIKWE